MKGGRGEGLSVRGIEGNERKDGGVEKRRVEGEGRVKVV